MTYREKIEREKAIKKAEEEVRCFEYNPLINCTVESVNEYGKTVVSTADYKIFLNRLMDLDLTITYLDYITGIIVWI
jgi:hypothetical protein